MALAFSPVIPAAKLQKQNLTITNITLDGTYPAGGWPVTAANLGLTTATSVIPLGSPGGATYEWISSTGKIMAFWADYDAVADGVLVQVTNAAILNNVVLPVLAIGI